jgi:hypothetical protein
LKDSVPFKVEYFENRIQLFTLHLQKGCTIFRPTRTSDAEFIYHITTTADNYLVHSREILQHGLGKMEKYKNDVKHIDPLVTFPQIPQRVYSYCG